MAEREMSGKALLDKLYHGLNTMPAVEAEMNARDLRSLNDEFLGKPTEPAASAQQRVAVSPAARAARSTARAKIFRSTLVVLFSVALVGMIATGALRASEKRAAALPPPPPAVVPASVPEPPVPVAELPPPEPVVLVNPFDASETFTFPPGTSKADARDQMATLLLQRATERGAHVPRARKLAAERRAPKSSHGS